MGSWDIRFCSSCIEGCWGLVPIFCGVQQVSTASGILSRKYFWLYLCISIVRVLYPGSFAFNYCIGRVIVGFFSKIDVASSKF